MARPPAGLVAFWVAVIATLGGGAAYLQILGPPPAPRTAKPAVAVAAPKPEPAAAVAATAPKPEPAAVAVGGASAGPAVESASAGPAVGSTPAGPAVGSAIAPPDPALLAPSVFNQSWMLPQIASDGRQPMRVYAAAAPTLPADAPRIAIVVAGIGYNRDLSLAAIERLPAPVSLALSPYGEHLDTVVAASRAAGHELLMGVPLGASELVAGDPSAGDQALIAGAPADQNERALDWSLSRAEGYAGVTDILNGSDNADFLTNPDARHWLMRMLAARGLFFIDGRTEDPQAPDAWSRVATVLMDPVAYPGNGVIDVQLQVLLTQARQDHVALGILSAPTPDAVKTIADWCNGLAAQGVALVPASAVVEPPTAPSTQSGPQ